MQAADVKNVAIVGAGLMGHSIGQEFATAGYSVRLHDQSDEQLRQALDRIRANLGQLEQTGRLSSQDAAATLTRIRTETDLQAAVADADLVIEAVFENLALKQSIFRDMDALSPAHAILASNTSSFMPSLLAEVTARPDRVLVAHYFNPPHLLPLVELVRSPHTSDATVATLHQVLTRVGKRPAVVAKEVPGFVGNRLQIALLREALAIVEQGIATPQDVDTIIRTGFGRRLAAAGVFEIFDIAGWDLLLAVAEQIQPSINASPEVSGLVRERIALKQRGAKDGQGFYYWTPEAVAELRERMARVLLAVGELT